MRFTMVDDDGCKRAGNERMISTGGNEWLVGDVPRLMELRYCIRYLLRKIDGRKLLRMMMMMIMIEGLMIAYCMQGK